MLILHAGTVLPVEAHAIEAGAVAVDGGVIAACGPYELVRKQFPSAEQIDVSNCALLPGLINAHTHLELSHLQGEVPYRGDFIDWVGRLTRARAAHDEDLSEVIADACRGSLAAGVTTVGDISFRHRVWASLADQPIRKTCFAEVFGMTNDLERPRRYLQQCIETTRTDSLLRLGISPHAPYSAGPGVYELAAQLAAEHGLTLATHLAETAAEVQFLQEGFGQWLDYLQRIHRWDGSFSCPHQRPTQYFLGLDLADQPFLLAHVNYIDDKELDALAKTKHSVAFCPRSHHFFDHPPHTFQRMVRAGINVCLGTDSLASNESLSILDEMRFIHRHWADLAGETLLRMATINGAAALGWQDKIGTITVGKEADLIAIELSGKSSDALSDILESTGLAKLTMVRGRIIGQ